MRNNIVLLTLLVSALLASCTPKSSISSIQQELNQFVADKDADIGIAVIIDGKDTVVVNGDKPFPMLSVYKLPIVIAFGDYQRVSNNFFPERIILTKDDLKPDTYSPMRDRYSGQDTVETDIHEIMAYALQQSDNNASDIILKIMGGPQNVSTALGRLGIDDIKIVSTEAKMHESPGLCYQNTSTPIAMAKMIDRFDREFDDRFSHKVKQLMETCATGENRLVKPLIATDVTIGHKTGTGFILSNSRLMAVNDAGYVHLSNGHRYSIAVFIENSGYDMAKTEQLIADISEIVLSHIK